MTHDDIIDRAIAQADSDPDHAHWHFRACSAEILNDSTDTPTPGACRDLYEAMARHGINAQQAKRIKDRIALRLIAGTGPIQPSLVDCIGNPIAKGSLVATAKRGGPLGRITGHAGPGRVNVQWHRAHMATYDAHALMLIAGGDE